MQYLKAISFSENKQFCLILEKVTMWKKLYSSNWNAKLYDCNDINSFIMYIKFYNLCTVVHAWLKQISKCNENKLSCWHPLFLVKLVKKPFNLQARTVLQRYLVLRETNYIPLVEVIIKMKRKNFYVWSFSLLRVLLLLMNHYSCFYDYLIENLKKKRVFIEAILFVYTFR